MTINEVIDGMELIKIGVGKPFPEKAPAVWFIGLGDLPYDAYLKAVHNFLRENKIPFAPTPGVIRERAIDLMFLPQMTAEQAYQRVRKAVVDFGYNQPQAACEALGEAIWQAVEGVGGWLRFCNCTPADRASIFRSVL